MESKNVINHERAHLRQFIAAYRNHPVLWDIKCSNYSKKDKRYEAYEEILRVYKLLRPDATIADVKKKINSMRSNFRKDMKKVEESALVGVQYKPSSWMYDELIFLNDSELVYSCGSSMHSGMTDSSVVVSDEEESKTQSDFKLQLENENTQQQPIKKMRYCESNDVNTLNVPAGYSGKIPTKTCADSNDLSRYAMDSSTCYYDSLVQVWAAKLKRLEPLQRVLAEKFINDILFEGELGSLHRDSLKINVNEGTHTIRKRNEEIRNSEPSQSSQEYKFSHTFEFTENDHNS